MRKLLTLFAATTFAATALMASPEQADARRYRHGYGGGAVAAAIIGGIALSALSHRRHRYYSSYDDGYGYGYYPRRSYYSSYSSPYYGRSYSRSRHYRGNSYGRHHGGRHFARGSSYGINLTRGGYRSW